MIRGTDVNFEYEYELPEPNGDGDYETLMLDVSANITDYYPAVMYLRNGDPGLWHKFTEFFCGSVDCRNIVVKKKHLPTAHGFANDSFTN